MNAAKPNLPQYLDERESELQKLIEGLYAQLRPFESELADVRKAKAAIAQRETGSGPARTTYPWQRASLDEAGTAHEQQELPVGQHSSPYASMTQQQLVVKALEDHFPNGATAIQLVEFFHNAWGRTDVIRSSLSPQLSRLKANGDIALAGKIWTLVHRKTEAVAQ